MSNIVGYKVFVTNSGTEKEFMTDFISTVTGLSDKITCSGSVDQYDSSDTSIKPEFVFSIHGKPTLTMQRANTLANTNNVFNVSLYVGNNSISTNQQCPYSGSASAASANSTRTFALSWITSGDFILLALMSVENYGYKHHVIVSIKSGNNVYGDGYFYNWNAYLPTTTIFNIKQKPITHTPLFNFYNYDIGDNGIFTSRFAFSSKPGTIDYIKSSPYIDNGYKKFDITSVYDCTTVTIGDTVSLKDGAYLAVGTNQLVKVS